MKKTLLAALLALATLSTGVQAAESRCGWLQNPTPGNWWLDDADGMDRIPDISEGDYVRTNGNYGYACACMTVDTDDDEGRILAIYSFRQLPISQCANDEALSAPE
nr:DUF4087 domain-containing protein [uncultured Shinella sp.]